ncbi:9909_t:CDS:1, partial [Paraglomus occultum]
MTPTSTPTSTPVNFTHVSFFDIHNLLNVTFVLCFTECELDKWFIARPTFTCLILVLLFILYLYVAIVHYPAYRCNKHITRRNARTASLEDTSQNRLVYVIVFPFALIYISLRIAWELYRQCVFYSLDTIEFVIRLVPRGLAVLWRNYLRIVMKTIVHVMKTIVLGTWYIIRSILRTSVRAIWKSLIFGYNAIWKTCAYSWNTIKRSCVYVWRDVGKRLLFAICINPTKWAIRRGIYLSRIACYVACFIIRDMLEDVRDLVFLGCDSSRRIWNSTIVPAGHVAYHAIAYSRATVRVYGSKVRAHLYKRVFIAGTSELTWIVGEVLRDPILRYVAETGYGTIRRAKFCLSFMAVSMKQCVTQGLYAMQRLLSQALYFIQRLLSQALYFIQRL